MPEDCKSMNLSYSSYSLSSICYHTINDLPDTTFKERERDIEIIPETPNTKTIKKDKISKINLPGEA